MDQKGDYEDDPSVQDDAALWRRISPIWFVEDENLGGVRPSSAAFCDSKDGSPMSVLIEEIVVGTGRTAADVLRSFDGYAMCSFPAQVARQLEQKVATRPEVQGEPAHGFVVGRKTQRVKRGLARASIWVVGPSTP